MSWELTHYHITARLCKMHVTEPTVTTNFLFKIKVEFNFP